MIAQRGLLGSVVSSVSLSASFHRLEQNGAYLALLREVVKTY